MDDAAADPLLSTTWNMEEAALCRRPTLLVEEELPGKVDLLKIAAQQTSFTRIQTFFYLENMYVCRRKGRKAVLSAVRKGSSNTKLIFPY